jgi:hypothetical protein
MKIEAVALMREARERIRNDIEAMSWIEEHEYLRSHLGWYESRLSPTPRTRRGALNVALTIEEYWRCHLSMTGSVLS